MDTFLGIAAVFVLVFINGFFVAAEFALVGARETRIQQLANEGSAAAKVAHNALKHLDSYIAATQLGITLASLALGWVGEPAVSHLFEAPLEALLPHDVLESIGKPIAVAVSFALVTMLHIIFGELAPKAMALQRPEDISLIIARPTALFLFIFNPVIRVMNFLGNLVVRLLGFMPASGHSQVHSAEELAMLVRSSGEAGVLEASEERLLRRAFDFGDLRAYQVMRPRVAVDAIELGAPLQDILRTMSQHHHSRYPVYDGTIDRVVGVLHTKDLFDLLVKQPSLMSDSHARFAIKGVLRTPLFVPENASVDDLLQKMQAARMHFAVIIDEYGGMAGVATMEDVLEELVGELQDEFDVEGDHIVPRGEAMLVDGLSTLAEVAERFGEPDGAVESATIGGYVAERLDRIPAAGDTVRYGRYQVTVIAMDGRRVEQVRFSLPPPLPEQPSGAAGTGDKSGGA